LPTTIKRYEQEAGLGTVQHIVVDREGMAAEFLAALKEAGRTAISVLRTDQYGGLDSFTNIGVFVPLRVSKHGDILREVAPTSTALPLPEQKGQTLQLRVALIRDLRHHVPVPPTKDELDYKNGWLTPSVGRKGHASGATMQVSSTQSAVSRPKNEPGNCTVFSTTIRSSWSSRG